MKSARSGAPMGKRTSININVYFQILNQTISIDISHILTNILTNILTKNNTATDIRAPLARLSVSRRRSSGPAMPEMREMSSTLKSHYRLSHLDHIGALSAQADRQPSRNRQ